MMLARLTLFAVGLWASAALAQNSSPFAPPPAPPPKIVRLLAPPAVLDLDALQAFEGESGYQVAYDAYEGALDLAEKWREGPYDLVVLSGPALARQIAAGALARLDKARIANASGVRPAALAKLAAYDPTGAYALPLGWYATGLVYAADKAAQRIGGAPASWNALFTPGEARKMADCGVALPDDRDALFVAAWRLLGVDPARATPAQVKSASGLIDRSRKTARAFPVADVASALASGAACLSVGDAGEAEAAKARSRQGGVGADIRFALPKEGGGLAVEAYAIPGDALHGELAHALLDFLLSPDVARRNADAARLVNPEAADQDETLKRLSPQGAYDPHVAPLVEAEWEQLVSNKATPAAAAGKTRAAQEHKPSTLDKVSKKRRWPPAQAPR
jgi:putrescine transport system substrate-binding protein